jgi:hypothetical protein
MSGRRGATAAELIRERVETTVEVDRDAVGPILLIL